MSKRRISVSQTASRRRAPQLQIMLVASPRILPVGRGCAGLADGRSDRCAAIQAAARWYLAAGEHASRQGPLCARGRRRSAQPVEHAAGAACPRLVRAVRCLRPITSLDIPHEGADTPLYNPQEWSMAEGKSEILQGTLDLMALKTLDAMGPMHGYGIARRIEQLSEQTLLVN